MKLKFLYYILFAASILTMSACAESDDKGGNDTPPAGSLPSTEFKPNNLPDEPYAEDAIRIEAQNEQAPFYAIELMGDGYYLLSSTRPYYSFPVSVAAKSDGSISVSKKRNSKVVRSRATRADDGTITLSTGETYGKFTKLGDKKYRLSNGIEIDLMDATGSDKTVTYRDYDGLISTVYVNVSEPISEDATKSLCRKWNIDSLEFWAYWNGTYVAHGKQTITNGNVDSYFHAIGGNLLDRDDFIDDDTEACTKMVFTPIGTCICFYADGDVERVGWQWVDKGQGIMHYEDLETNEYYDDERDDGYFTIRFAGNQMRIYEDYTCFDDDIKMRTVGVNTLTAAN